MPVPVEGRLSPLRDVEGIWGLSLGVLVVLDGLFGFDRLQAVFGILGPVFRRKIEMMKSQFFVCCSILSLSVVLLGASVGCDKKQAEDAVKSAEDAVKSAEESAEKAADAIAEDVGDAVEKGGEMASELGEKAMGFVGPLKDKFGSLDSLKDKPEELKTAVSELIQSIEDKAADIELPEAMSTALETVKEKLVALQEYLEGEVEQANIDERLKDIGDSVKSGLGM